MFLRYLLEQKIIDEEMCIKSFGRAQELNKSFFDFIVKKQFLKPAQLTDLIIAHLENGKSFSTLLKDYMEESKRGEIISEYFQSNKSIYDFLVDSKYVTADKLKGCYEEYKKSSEVKTVTPAPEVEISAAALESLRELTGTGKIDPSIMAQFETPSVANPIKDEFFKVFSENRFKKIKKLITLMMDEVKKNGQASNYLNSFYQELHLVQGAANMAGVQSLVKLLSSFEEKLESIMQQDETVIKEWINLNHSALEKFVEKTWEFRLKESA